MMQNDRYPDSKNCNSIQQGLEFQDFVMETLWSEYGLIIQNYTSKKYQLSKGENVQGFEIKLDNWCTQTHRLSIEVAERTAIDRPWVDSGIYAGKSIFYIHGNLKCFWLFLTSFLQRLHRTGRYETKTEATIKAFYLPEADAGKYGVQVKPSGD